MAVGHKKNSTNIIWKFRGLPDEDRKLGGFVMSTSDTGGYAGDVAPEEAWASLSSDPRAVLVDVRTTAEWAFVGLPDLRDVGKRPVTIEWQVFPSMAVDPSFVTKLSERLAGDGVDTDAPVYFLCRSGVRSLHAATAMTEAGWSRCYNVSGGFEGPPDTSAHRGAVAGWKARGLPWTQS
jgi:rhodanese-related sulfurtransferase